ncbi:hypothetical protein WL058_23010 [Vibrio alginolyticus]|uniref:hypothetical protein n=2 Tax=Vibrio harveyi group TaxID=717610 RepID=UPI0037552947
MCNKQSLRHFGTQTNKQFKSDSARLAFLVSVKFSAYGGQIRCRGRVLHTLIGRYNSGGHMKYFFHPKDEETFKVQAVGNFVRTLVFDPENEKVLLTFHRKVSKVWEQTRKNNIETDHRIKELTNENLHFYSWVVSSKTELLLPNFSEPTE